MELNKEQFNGYLNKDPKEIKPLNKWVGKMYPQITEQLNILIKQAKLNKLKKEIDKTNDPHP